MKKIIAVLLVNLLTTIRIIGVFLLVPIYHQYGGVSAAKLSIGCYFTDLLDGVIARKCKVSTFFGSCYDGIADKAFTCANLLVLFTITKWAIIPILFELAIIGIQTIKYQQNENVQSSKAGKLKTWVISLTVILLYLVIEIKSLTFLPDSFVNMISSLDQNKLLGCLFMPLYVFEVLTLYSYLKYLKNPHHDVKKKLPKIDLKLKPATSMKNKWDNFCLLWLNHDFYEKYKNEAGLKEIRRYVKENR